MSFFSKREYHYRIGNCQYGSAGYSWKGSSGTKGQYGYFNSTTCPSGWVLANGSNGTVDLRGEFIRSWDAGRGVDGGRGLGSYQEQRTNNLGRVRYSYASGTNSNVNEHGGLSSPVRTGDGTGYGLQFENRGGETRSRNIALLACMKE